MNKVLITTQSSSGPYSELHVSLDLRWIELLSTVGLVPILVPNNPNSVLNLWTATNPCGVILSGSGEFSREPSDFRSRIEEKLIQLAHLHEKPILGVCRGMQSLLIMSGQPLISLDGQISEAQNIRINQEFIQQNSYHTLGCISVAPPFKAWAWGESNIIKAIEHESLRQFGIMWHPERDFPFKQRNVEFLKTIFIQQEFPCAHLF